MAALRFKIKWKSRLKAAPTGYKRQFVKVYPRPQISAITATGGDQPRPCFECQAFMKIRIAE